MTTVNLVTICHHTELLQYYWLYSQCCYEDVVYNLTWFFLNKRALLRYDSHKVCPLKLVYILVYFSIFTTF